MNRQTMSVSSHNPARRSACGTWPSPITTKLITGDSVRLSAPSVDGADIYWVESRPSEMGRSVIVRRSGDGSTRDLVPPPFNVRSRVHEYGGGAYLATAGRCWFVNFDDQQIYEAASTQRPQRLTNLASCRFADMEPDLGRNRLLAVCEDHSGTGQASNSIAQIDLASGQLKTLLEGADFYSNPRLSPDGKQLAWLCWNHPQMPWDGTELWVASLDPQGEVGQARMVAGGARESVFQPQWGQNGSLYFVSDADQWWNLYRWESGTSRQLTHEKAEMGLPQWVFGMSTYGLVDQRRAVAVFRSGGSCQARLVALDSGETRALDLQFSTIEHVEVDAEKLLLLAATDHSPPAVISCALSASRALVLRQGFELALDPKWIARPEHIRFATSNGEAAYGFFYPPTNPDRAPLEHELPPLIVTCHGGPTSAASPGLDLRLQYWTSRGFAVLDVDYRGSTGYGREYRESLYGRWGIADVEDCVNGAQQLAAMGKVDPERLLIRGGSAGGYVVLCAASFHDVFRAGASYYGIGELESMFAHTHKFESHYDRSLLGEGDQGEILAQRSPARHAEKIRMALIFFQGMDDKVVPPEQSERMFEIVKQQGAATAYLAFENEGHGFRNADTISRCLNAELAFYARVLNLGMEKAPADLQIENLSGR